MEKLATIVQELQQAEQPRLALLRRAPEGVTKAGERLGVFSGSFNPPTIAHVRLCEQAQAFLQLREVLLLLALVNVDKTQFDFSLDERVAMMLAIANEHPNWSVALCSHGRFVEKAEAVVAAYPPGVEVWFLVGYDTFVRLFEPRFYPDVPMADALKRFFTRASLAVFPRGEFDEEALRTFLTRPEAMPFAHRILAVPFDPSLRWVSSTIVRQKWRQGEPVDEWVPPPVAKFLRSRSSL